MRGRGEIERVEVRAYRIPTEEPESDGTYQWDATTIVVVHLFAGGVRGVGYSYADGAAARLVQDKLGGILIGRSAHDLSRCWGLLLAAVRNLGCPGISLLAVSALDVALWDLKAKLLDLPLVDLLGAARDEVPVYNSGGFTSYGPDQLLQQLQGWVSQGISGVKMKIGRDPGTDPERVALAREAIGSTTRLMVDANGGYQRKEALALAEIMAQQEVCWLEEPVIHTDRQGLRLLRDRAPAQMEIAAGEYGFTLEYFRHMLDDQAVDVLQADASRCGITGFMQAATLCESHHLPLSSHCAPALHLHPACALRPVRHLEYFHDHVRIERMLFEGVAEPVRGKLRPDRSRPGLGIELKDQDARRFEL